MKISLNWLRDFIDIPQDVDTDELGQLFTLRTAEVEHIDNIAKLLDHVVIGKIETIEKHPDADKLQVTKTDIGGELSTIVCGASNIKEGILVAVAKPGSQVRWHGEGDLVKLEKAKIRGVESFGMICAGEEIGLAPTPEGILDLSHLNDQKPGTPLAHALGRNDHILDIDNKSLTHRPDLWGHYGIAREVAAITNKELKPFHIDPQPTYDTKEIDIKVEATELCPRYIGAKIENIKVEPSPDWMQNRLEAIGYKPINNIVDATNYVMAELGQPLHAFDAKKVSGGIVVRTAKKGEEIETLDETKRKLEETMLLIADHEKPIAIAGVMGGANSEIDDNTTELILEAATFHPSSVRITSTKLGLRSEAVQRFEKSLDPHLPAIAMDRVCQLILQMCPEAKITSAKTDVKNFDESTKTVKVNLPRVRTKIGADVETQTAIDLLESVDFKVLSNEKDQLEVEIPTFRSTKDVEIEDDITEEIARLYGYENIQPVVPALPTKHPKEHTERKLKHYARRILSHGLGFDEIYNYSFYSIKDIKACLIPEELHVKVENYLSEEQTHMRVSLVPNMLRKVAENIKNFEEFKLYEVGRTYLDLQEFFPTEEKKICGMVVKPMSKGKDKDQPEKQSFYEAKGALEELLSHFNTGELDMRKGEAVCWYAHPGRYAQYFTQNYTPEDNNEIARLFDIHPLVLRNHDLQNVQISVFEINFTKLASLGATHIKYEPLPKFPSIQFDVAALINKTQPVGNLIDAMNKVDSQIIKSIELFDLYQGENIPEDRKSCAFRVELRANDRTLKDEEMRAVQEKIFTSLENLGAEIRGRA